MDQQKNAPETESEGTHWGTLRRLQALHRSKVLRDQTRALSQSPNNTLATTASPFGGKPNMSR